jgi:hypothetical protein
VVVTVGRRRLQGPAAEKPIMWLLSWMWVSAVKLVNDLAGDEGTRSQPGDDELAQWDDVLDAWLDDDGMDATGL